MMRLSSLALFALVVACSNDNYSHANVMYGVGSTGASINFNTGISIPEGAVVSADITLIADNGDTMSAAFESDDPSVLEVYPATTGNNDYVFLGVGSGQTFVRVLANGQPAATVQAVVTAPPSGTVVSLPFEAGVTPEVDAGVDGASDASIDADDGGASHDGA
jgi:hypothetical protein